MSDARRKTVGQHMFAELTQPDFARLAFEIGQRFGHSSLHCVAFLELANFYGITPTEPLS